MFVLKFNITTRVIRFLTCFFCCFFVSVVLNATSQKYVIKGTLQTDEFNGNWVYVAETLRKLSTEPIDSAMIVDGRFEMEGVAEEPLMAVAVVADASRNMVEKGVGTYFILENGNIDMYVDTTYEMRATGTELNRVYWAYDSIILSYDDITRKIVNSEVSNAEKYAQIVVARENHKETLKNLILPYIATQPAKKFVKDIKHLFTREELMILLPNDGDNGDDNSKREYMAIGSFVTEEEVPNSDGEMVRLMDVISQHEYTLIDFWASWCGPCLKSMPWLKEIYEKHAGDHFEIIGISLDNSRDRWLGAIKRLELNWVQLSNLMAWQDPMVKRFEIPFIPSMILVNREGRIILRNPNHDELEIYLAQ